MPEEDPLAALTRIRALDPERVRTAVCHRRRRPLLSQSGTMFLIAADHPARGVLKVGSDRGAMADRGELLNRLIVALARPGVDGVLATPDVAEELALLGALEEKLVFGTMNRGGLAGSVYELDDRLTAYTAEAVQAQGLDGGKLMTRIADDDRGSLETLVATARTINELAARKLVCLVEVFASRSRDGRAANLEDAESLIRAIGIVQALGTTSAYTWLKLPVVAQMERVLRATSLPTLLLGGDPGDEVDTVYRRWQQAMSAPQVVGLVVGRSLLYPRDGDVAHAVDEAAEVVKGAAVERSGPP